VKFLEMHFFGLIPLQTSCKGVLTSLEQIQKFFFFFNPLSATFRKVRFCLRKFFCSKFSPLSKNTEAIFNNFACTRRHNGYKWVYSTLALEGL